MRLGITTFGADGGRSGIGRYVVSLLRELDGAPGVDCEVLVHPEERDAFAPKGSPLRVLEVGGGRHPVANIAWHQLALPGWCRRRGYDVLFLPAANRRLGLTAPCPRVGTVHDMASLHVAGKYDPLRTAYVTRVLPRLFRGLDHVLTVSEASRRDIVTCAGVAPERVTAVHLGVDHERYHPGDREAARERVAGWLGAPGPYLLYVARIEHPGKNHVGLLRAFARFKERTGLPHRLVLAGGDWLGAEAVHRAAAASRWSAAVTFTGFVAEGRLPDLYRAADLFAMPSLYEGFGLPLVEAMACGTAAICSDRSSLPEVAGAAALTFDPDDEEGMAAAMARLLGDDAERDAWARRGRARAAEFTWSTTARRTLEAIRAAA